MKYVLEILCIFLRKSTCWLYVINMLKWWNTFWKFLHLLWKCSCCICCWILWNGMPEYSCWNTNLASVPIQNRCQSGIKIVKLASVSIQNRCQSEIKIVKLASVLGRNRCQTHHFGIGLASVPLEPMPIGVPFWHRFFYFWHRGLWHRYKTVAKHGHGTDAIGLFSTSASLGVASRWLRGWFTIW